MAPGIHQLLPIKGTSVTENHPVCGSRVASGNSAGLPYRAAGSLVTVSSVPTMAPLESDIDREDASNGAGV
jgi:hypothetical protein